MDEASTRLSGSSLQRHVVITLVFVASGCVNTLLLKCADLISAAGQKGVYQKGNCSSDISCPINCNASDEAHSHQFNHPFFQAFVMFLGEMVCIIVFKLNAVWTRCNGGTPARGKPFSPFIFLLPALFDMISSSTMKVGLTMTYASSYQMLRAAVVVFTGLLSIILLRPNHSLHVRHWGGILHIIIGLVLVGAASKLQGSDKGLHTNSQLTGDLLVVASQLIFAMQIIYEEKFIKQYDVPPLQAVGWEGIWGTTLLGLLLIAFYYIPLTMSDLQPKRLENSIDALYQIHNSLALIFSNIGVLLSIAVFNYCSITVIKTTNATNRVVLDSFRTLFIWMISLAVGWETFYWLRLLGYLVLLSGTITYYNALSFYWKRAIWPLCIKLKIWRGRAEETPLVSDREAVNYA